MIDTDYEAVKKEALIYLRISFAAFNILALYLWIIDWPYTAFIVFCLGVQYQYDVYKLQIFDNSGK